MSEETKQSRNDVATDVSNWFSAVIALTKLTQTGNLNWRRITPSEAFRDLRPDGEVEYVYISEFKDSNLRLYEEADITVFKNSVLKILGEHRPSKRIVLEMVDSNLKNLFTFPQVNALAGLLSAVKYQVSDVRNVLDDIVKEADLIETK